MGNCHRKEFVHEENLNEKVNYLIKDEVVKSITSKNDRIYEFIQQIIFPKNLKCFSLFKNSFKIKKNLRCQKDIFYRVKQVENIRTGRLFKVKIISNPEIEKMGFECFRKIFSSEMKVLQNTNSRFMEKLIGVFIDREDKLNVYILVSFTSNYTFLDDINNRIAEKRRYEDQEIAIIINFFAELLFKLNSEKIIYRNLNLENISFLKEKNYHSLCARNFYFSTSLDSSLKVRGVTRPLWSMAPEVLEDKLYDCKADVWSAGVALYTILSLENPFIECRNFEDMMELLNSKNSFKAFKKISTLEKYGVNPAALKLTLKMLELDCHKRISHESIIEDKYFKENNDFSDVKIIKELVEYSYINNNNYVEKLKFKIKNSKAYHNLIYFLFFNLKDYLTTFEENVMLNKFYNLLDSKKDGICKENKIEEILSKYKDINLKRSTIASYIDLLNTILNNELHQSELSKIGQQKNGFLAEHFLVGNIFLNIYSSRESDLVKRKIKVMFYELDFDRSNSMSLNEIEEAVGNIRIVTKKDYIKILLKQILNDPLFNWKISDFNNISLKQFENLLFYDCISLTAEQMESENQKDQQYKK